VLGGRAEGDMTTTQTGSRNEARSIIEELWAEREQSRPAPAPVGKKPPTPGSPRRPASSRERKLATAVVLLLVGNGLAIGAKALGLVGGASKATFVAQADAICAPANAQMAGLTEPYGYSAVATTAATLLTTADAQVKALRSLELPAYGHRSDARGVLAAMGRTVDAGRSLQTAAEARNAAMTATAARTMTFQAEDAATRAKAFGLSACGSGMQSGVEVVLGGADEAVKGSLIADTGVLCRDLVRNAEALPVPKSASELDFYMTKSTALYDTFVTGLRALPVPRGDEAKVAELASGMVELGAKVRQMGAAAMNGDAKRVNAIEKEGDALADALDAKFSAYGFTNCGS
jgi:hypothetical protein